MKILFKPMNDDVFHHYLHDAIKSYAIEKTEAGTYTKEESIQRAAEEFQLYLPKGKRSANHYFFQIYDKDTAIGVLWYQLRNNNKDAFIYDFLIQEKEQNKGYGKAALAALDDHLTAKGAESISLHVFAHNQRAVHVYEKHGFQATDIMMKKKL